MLTLYYAPNSVALSAHIALAESGLAYTLDRIDHGGEKRTSDGRSFFDLSPAGYVPALQMADGSVLTESAAILIYIADIAPNDGLCPPLGTFARYEVLKWVAFVATELHQKVMRFTLPGLSETYREANLAQGAARLKMLDESLRGRSGLVGDHFTIGDIFAWVAVRWWAGMIDLAPYPDLGRFMAEVATRPSVRRALIEEGIT